VDGDPRAGQARLAQAFLDSGGHRGAVEVTVEVAVDHRGDVGAALGLADLELTDGRGAEQRGADREGVHAGLRIPEDVIGATVDAGA